MQLTPGQRKTLLRVNVNKKQRKPRWWDRIFNPPADDEAYWQGR